MTDEKENEGGARHLSLALSMPPIERRWERQVTEADKDVWTGTGDRSQTSKGIGLPACSGSGRVAGSSNPDH